MASCSSCARPFPDFMSAPSHCNSAGQLEVLSCARSLTQKQMPESKALVALDAQGPAFSVLHFSTICTSVSRLSVAGTAARAASTPRPVADN